jgi:hypothetical protein
MSLDAFYNFSANVCIENDNLLMEKLVGFDLITLIGELNPDICQSVQLTKHSDSHASLTVVLQHFFEDIGCPQVYLQSSIQMQQTTQIKTPIYRFTLEQSISPNNTLHIVPNQCLQVFIENAECIVECISIHTLKISVNFKIDPTQLETVPTFAMSLINTLTLKILKQVKTFIENM